MVQGLSFVSGLTILVFYISRLLEERETKVLELETKLEDLGDLAGDKAELLEGIQSDKTALSRALTQNKDLKQQLAELQNGFVKMVGIKELKFCRIESLPLVNNVIRVCYLYMACIWEEEVIVISYKMI